MAGPSFCFAAGSPYYTFSIFRGVLVYEGSDYPIGAYFKNGKVPVWAFREVEEPTYNIPVSLLVKEIATKINSAVFQARASDAEVSRLVKRTRSRSRGIPATP